MQLISLSSNFFLDFSEQKFESINERESLESWFKTFWNKISFGYRFILQSDVLKHLLVLSAVINAVGAASFSVLPETIMIKELNFTPQQVGIVSTVFVVGSLVGSLLLSKKKVTNPLYVVKYAFIVVAVFLLSFTLPVYVEMKTVTSMAYIALIGLSMALVFQFISIPMSSYMQKTIPDEYKGRVFSINGTISMILMPIGTIIYGALYEKGIYFSSQLIFLNYHCMSRISYLKTIHREEKCYRVCSIAFFFTVPIPQKKQSNCRIGYVLCFYRYEFIIVPKDSEYLAFLDYPRIQGQDNLYINKGLC